MKVDGIIFLSVLYRTVAEPFKTGNIHHEINKLPVLKYTKFMGLTLPFTLVTFTLFPVNQNIPGKPADPEPY